MNRPRSDRERATQIVRDAGGEIVGRTRLQKVAYLLDVVGLGHGFDFEYRHYGPFSDSLANAMRGARAFGLVREEEHPTDWGGFYSIYRLGNTEPTAASSQHAAFTKAAAGISSIELELLATAAFLHAEGAADPWAETGRRKPDKAADGRLENAKASYANLRQIPTPKPLPDIV